MRRIKLPPFGRIGVVSGDLLMAAIKKTAQPCNIFTTNYVYWI